jgi:ATP-dependent Clp protease ATP-binding subunit ClpC
MAEKYKLTDCAIAAWKAAAAEAVSHESPEITPRHLLIGFARLCAEASSKCSGDGFAAHSCVGSDMESELAILKHIFSLCGVSPVVASGEIKRGFGKATGNVIHRSAECREVFDRATATAAEHPGGDDILDAPTLLRALVSRSDPDVSRAAAQLGADRLALAAAAALFARTGKADLSDSQPGAYPPERSAASSENESVKRDSPAPKKALKSEKPLKHHPFIAEFGSDISSSAARGELPPAAVPPRSGLLRELARALSRLCGGVVFLSGKPGSARDELVRALALEAVGANAKDILRSMRFFEFDLARAAASKGSRPLVDVLDVLVGEMDRLAFENKELILTTHIINSGDNLAAACATAGKNANSGHRLPLAELCGRENVRFVISVSPDEFTRIAASHPGPAGKFLVIEIPEPTPEEVFVSLTEARDKLQKRYGVKISDEALREHINLASRNHIGETLMDGAMSLLEESCSASALDTIHDRFGTKEGYEGEYAVTARDAVRAVMRLTGLSAESALSGGADESLTALESALSSRVVGQPRAVSAVIEAVRASIAGLATPGKPKCVLLFIGPTGVGKTETAKALAEALLGSPDKLVRFDMSEFMQKHNVNRLLGAPPGYVGHEGDSLLALALAGSGQKVVLFDEIEKAHPDVMNIFLQIFDEGMITDNHGARISFRDSYIILTSNLLAANEASETRNAGIGFRAAREKRSSKKESSASDERLRAALVGVLKPELANRIGRVVSFEPLSRESLETILDKIVGARIGDGDLGFKLVVDDDVRKLLLDEGSSELFGVRELERTVGRLLFDPLAEVIIKMKSGGSFGNETLRASLSEGRIIIS